MEPQFSQGLGRWRTPEARTLVFMHVTVLALALGLHFSGWSQGWEFKALDYFFRVRHALLGPRLSPDLAFIGIDDKSLDPSYSRHADLWGRGGWVTRELWSLPMQFHREVFQPRVLAYDILLRANPPHAENILAAKISETLFGADITQTRALFRAVQEKGDKEIQKQLWDIGDQREAGGAAPAMLFAFDFPEDEKSQARVDEATRAMARAVLQKYRLPEGSVTGAGTFPVYPVARLPLPEVVEAPVFLAPINVPRDADGVVRRVPLLFAYVADSSGQVGFVPGFAFLSLLLQLGIEPAQLQSPGQGLPCISVQPGRELVLSTKQGEWRVPVDHNLAMALNARVTYADLRPASVSYVEVMDGGLALQSRSIMNQLGSTPQVAAQLEEDLGKGHQALQRLQGKLVVVAPSATGVGDYGPYSLDQYAPNAMAHLLAINTLVQRDFLRMTPPSWERWLLLGLAGGSLLLFVLLPSGRASLCAGLLVLLYPLTGLSALAGVQLSLPLVLPTMEVAALFGLNAYYFYRRESVQKEQVRKMFSTMVSPRVLEMMEENPAQFGLGGVRREATLFFSDLGGFTSISEKLGPTELCQLLNRYFTPMTDLILEQDGYLKEYAGDGIVAAWGLPYPDPDHAWKAVQCALKQCAALDILSAQILEETGVSITMRIGINSGTVSAGNMGSQRRFQYGMMGDAVNLAARLEPINKDFQTRVILSEFTRERVATQVHTRLLDSIVVKGKSVPVRIYELIGPAEGPLPVWVTAYEKGFDLYRQRQWEAAEAAFRECQAAHGGQDGAARTMLARVELYRQNPPPETWQGEFVKTTKG